MKVLYIGNYRDGTGWANACINNILALDSAGVDVVPRAITFESQQQDYPDRIKELESVSSEDCDVCIQHTLPHLYSYDSNYKNIGFLAVESSNFRDTGWQHNVNLMDELWVPSSATKVSCENSGVKIPVKIAPHSLDISKYKKNNGGNQIQELQPTFNFTFIGEFIERKNLQALIKAFHMEFDFQEPVNLFIKTSKVQLPQIQEFIKHVKSGLKIRSRYKEEIIIAGRLDDKDYISVLGQCHSFVMPSRGEAFCIPALEAMAMGIPVIHTENTGMDDFCVGEAVPSIATPCLGAVSTLANLDTANSDWREIDIRALCAAMRRAYQSWKSDDEKIKIGQTIAVAKTYDHKPIGHEMKELLNDS
jgi:glycosyltransferase involved in cell wall biosynthesis|tara:strand:- start:701 stop:1786 length:1086 start_codon:yes stop_codon:yes gene_type:complete